MIKRSEQDASLLAGLRSELETMNKLHVHDMIKRSEQDASLLAGLRSELETMNRLHVHDMIKLHIHINTIDHLRRVYESLVSE